MGQFGPVQTVALSLGVDTIPVGVRDRGDIERALTAFAHSSNGGLFVTASPLATLYREPIIALAARFKLPTVYSEHHLWVSDGGLISYASNVFEQFGRAAAYVDRILKGEKPAVIE